jgi:hypothetical protein
MKLFDIVLGRCVRIAVRVLTEKREAFQNFSFFKKKSRCESVFSFCDNYSFEINDMNMKHQYI